MKICHLQHNRERQILYDTTKKIKQTSEYNQKNKKQTHRYREKTSGYQWGGNRGQNRGSRVRGTNYYV